MFIGEIIVTKDLIQWYFLTISQYKHLQDRWIGDHSWFEIINDHYGLKHDKVVCKHAFNKHMSTLKTERKIVIQGEVFTTAQFKLTDYVENKTVGTASFNYIKATKKKI